MAALYEINHQILECVDAETGEIVNEEMLDQLLLDRNTKIENIALWIKNLLSEAAGIDAECKNLTERKKSAEKRAEGLKRYLSENMNGTKFSTPRVAISFRKSEAVEILSDQDIPDDFVKIVEERKIDKTAIKQAIKADREVPGAVLVERQNIQIK